MAGKEATTMSKARIAKRKRRLFFKHVQQKLAPVAFAIVVLALGVAMYQFFLADSVRAVMNELRDKPKPVQIGCSLDAEVEANTPKEVIAASYQQFIRSQSPTTGSLLRNTSLQGKTGDAAGYSKSVLASWASYETIKEDGSTFLRTTTTKAVSDQDIAATWLMRDVPIAVNGTYVYDLEYRSTVPVTVGLEYVMSDGTIRYHSVTELGAQKNWQRFTYYARNDVGASSFRFVVAARQPGQVDVKNHNVYGLADARLAEGLVTIAFDDGWQSVARKAVPLLDKYGFKSTQYIISDASTETPVAGYMSAAEVKAMKDNGHEIGSHTLTHCDQTHLSAAQVTKDAKDSKAKLEAQGLGPITSLAYPYGMHNGVTRGAAGEQYDLLRGSDAGYNDRYFDADNVQSFGVLNTTTDEEIKAWLDYAKQNRVWVVLVYHRVDETGDYSVTSAQMDRQLSLVKQSGLRVETFRDAANAARR